MIFTHAVIALFFLLDHSAHAAGNADDSDRDLIFTPCTNTEEDASKNDFGCDWWPNLCVLADGKTEPALGEDGVCCARFCVNTEDNIFGTDFDCDWNNRCLTEAGIDPAPNAAGFKCVRSIPAGPGSDLDVVFMVDLSGSYTQELIQFKIDAPPLINNIKGIYTNARFGLGAFIDFPFGGWGSLNGANSDDFPYKRIRNLTGNKNAVIADIDNLSTQDGLDWPESQLFAIHQAISGTGLSPIPAGETGAGYSFPANQNMNFNDNAIKVMVLWTDANFHTPSSTPGYPGPSVDEVRDAALAEGILRRRLQTTTPSATSVRIVGINGGDDTVKSQLTDLAVQTGAISPGELKCCSTSTCSKSGPGAPIVCPSVDGENIGETMLATIMAAVNSAEVIINGGSGTGTTGPPPDGCTESYNDQGCQAGSYISGHPLDIGCSSAVYPQCSGRRGVFDSTAFCCKPGVVDPEDDCECATDDDCDGDFSFCGAADGSFMVGRPHCTCYRCIRDSYPSGPDTGCPAHAPVCTGPGIGRIPDCVGGTMCVGGDAPCYNTNEGTGEDYGCSEEEGTPLCVKYDGTEPELGLSGHHCV